MGGSALQVVLNRLADAGCPPRQNGDAWSARCPAHDDAKPSLSVSRGDDGRVLLHCHAGCPLDAVLDALSLTAADLFDDRPPSHDDDGVSYDYPDERGRLLFQVVRRRGKRFVQRRPDETGGWAYKLNGVRRVPYRLPEVTEAVSSGADVWVAEGEKDVDRLRALGLVATTNPGGAGNWREEYSEVLRGVEVTVVADHDEPGLAHARAVASSLNGVAAAVSVLVPPTPGHDVSDHLAAGRSLGELVVLDEAADTPASVDRLRETSADDTWDGGEDAAPSQDGPRLDDAALYGSAGELVRSLLPHTEASVPALLFTALTQLGAAIGPGPRFKVGGSWHHVALFTTIVGGTSQGAKGQSWDAAWAMVGRADASLGDRLFSGFGSGEAFIDAFAGDEANVAGPVVAPVADPRMLVYEPELARVLKVCGRSGDTFSPNARRAWDGIQLEARSRTYGHKKIGPPYVIAMVGHITPADLASHMADDDAHNGFANRFLWVWSTASKLLPSGGALDDDMLAELGISQAKILDKAQHLSGMHRSSGAEHRWSELYPELFHGVGDGMLAAITARGTAQCLRLSMLYAALDGSAVIEVVHLEAAWAAWRYCRDSAAFLFGPDGVVARAAPKGPGARFDDDLERLYRAIRQAGSEGLGVRGQRDVFSGHRSAVQLAQARSDLVKRRLIVVEDIRGRGGIRQVAKAAEFRGAGR